MNQTHYQPSARPASAVAALSTLPVVALAVQALGGASVDASYDYVWECAGHVNFPAKLDIETGEITISHDRRRAESRKDWLLREEVAIPVPGASSEFFSIAVRGGRLSAEALNRLQTRLADRFLGRDFRSSESQADDDKPF